MNNKETIIIDDIDMLDEFDEFNDIKGDDMASTKPVTKKRATSNKNTTTSNKSNSKKTNTRKTNSTKKNGKKKKPKKKGWARVRSILLKLFLIFLILGLLFTGIMLLLYRDAYNTTSEVNDENFWIGNSSTVILDNNDEYATTMTPNAIDWVPIKDENGEYLISEYYLEGIVAAEDAKFYEHGGVDLIGMVKATIRTLTGGSSGGSTITMQLAKLLYMPEWDMDDDGDAIYGEPEDQDGVSPKMEHPIDYKLTQMAYARKIEDQYTKDQILECYVNVIYFGNGMYGIKNASEYYFNKDPKDLTLTESATLAGITQLPSTWDPYTNPEGCKERRDYVLGRMLEVGDITQEEYDAAIATPIDDTLNNQEEAESTSAAKYTAYVDVVYRELLSVFDPDNTGDFNPATAGLTIHTNMDKDIQEHVYDCQNSTDPNLYVDDQIKMGSVIMDTQTGEILAIGSGRAEDASMLGTNYAYNYYRQPGSTSKPIIDYGPAIEYLGWSTAHEVHDEAITYDDGPSVYNADGKYLGDITMQEALDKSRNTTALETFKILSEEVGVNAIMEFAAGLGISDIDPNTFNQAYSIGGWTVGTTPIELAGAYAAFGNGGIYNEPHCIDYIEISPNSEYYEEFGAEYVYQYESHRAMKEETAFMISAMLDLDNPECTWYAGINNIPGLDLHAKTGTTDWGEYGVDYGIPEGAQRDKWVASYTPDVTCVTWTGYDAEDEQAGYYIPYDSTYESNMYKEIMGIIPTLDDEYLHDDTITQPDNVKAVKIKEGVWPPVEDPKGKTYYFIEGSEDYELVSKGFSKEKATSPKVTTKVNSNSIGVSWDYTGDFRDSAKWNIYIDGELYKTTTDMSISIPFSDITDIGGCKKDHTISVELVETNDNKETRKSAKVDSKVSIPDISYCQEVDVDVDSDKDGLLDSEEATLKTNPKKADTDGDGVNDGQEVTDGTDPLNGDTDTDGLTDGDEKTYGTDPKNPDTDADGVSDGDEITNGTDPLVP